MYPHGETRPRWVVVLILGVAQIIAWGSSYYLPTVLASPIERATGWPATWVLGGLSIGLLVSGLVSPRVGKLLHRFGGRTVLAASAVLLCLGLLVASLATNVVAYVFAWTIIGFGMGAGLYDPCFSTLGMLYREKAPALITATTLIAGFASTICWPLSAFLVLHVGWRGACVFYAILHIAVVLPLYLFGLPRHHKPMNSVQSTVPTIQSERRFDSLAFTLLSAGFALASALVTIFSVDLIPILHADGLNATAAVGIGALIGPSQVASRIVQFGFTGRYHPIWEMFAATAMICLGVGLLLFGSNFVVIGVVLYGAGSGLRSIARGTLPLALFGNRNIAILMGRLAYPSFVAQAAAPALGGLLFQRTSPAAALICLTGAAAVNVVLVILLVLRARVATA